MKLEVGMYCFNKVNRKQGIGKIFSEPTKYNNVAIEYKDEIFVVSVGNIVASHNIMDLIEVGDYVNGDKVNRISKDINKTLYVETGFMNDILYLKNIKSIATKEQFESMQYKIN